MDIIFIILGIVILYIIYIINKFVYLKKRVLRSKSVIDVFLKKRYDLIPNLVEVVKGYTKYEKETLQEIVNLRNSFNNNVDIESGNKLNEYFKNIVAVIESYPEIKAHENFLNLQKSLEKVESEIQASRRIYINDITNYNTKIETFPNSFFAKIFGFKPMELPLFLSEEVFINFN